MSQATTAAPDRTAARRPRRRGRAGEKAIELVFAGCGYVSVAVLGGIFVLLLWQGAKAFREIPLWEFLTSIRWDPTSPEGARYGIGSMVASTGLVTFGAMAITVPVGIGVAAYLSEFAPPRVREVLKPAVEMLASIPSVVVGFIGIVVVGPAIARLFDLPHGLTALNGAVLLAVMALPTAVSLSEDALRSVPRDHRLASLALGANPWETLVKVTLPAAAPGITAAMMLAMGRAVGETMTVLMATGNALALPHGLLSPVRTLTATVAIELGEVPHGTAHYFALFAVGLALFVLSFGVNWAADWAIRRGADRR